jgi:hypothetical protein
MARSFSSVDISTEKKIEKFKNLISQHYQDYENLRKTKKNFVCERLTTLFLSPNHLERDFGLRLKNHHIIPILFKNLW